MQVRDDQGVDLVGVDIYALQNLAWQRVDLAAAAGGFLVLEAGVDDDRAVVVADDPDEIIDRTGLAWSSSFMKLK